VFTVKARPRLLLVVALSITGLIFILAAVGMFADFMSQVGRCGDVVREVAKANHCKGLK
jgi:hypothetical protein